MRRLYLALLAATLLCGAALAGVLPFPPPLVDEGGSFLTEDSLDNTIVAIDNDQDSVWIGTLRHFGRSLDDGETWTAYGTSDGLPGPASDIGTVRVADDGDVYLGCFHRRQSPFDSLQGAGLARSRDNGATWRTFTTADGLTNNAVWDTESDGEGTVWAACWSGGVNISRDDGASWEAVVPSPLEYGDNVFALARGDGYLFAGTGGGLGISADGGSTWQAIVPPPISLPGGYFVTSPIVGFLEYQPRVGDDYLWVGTVADGRGWYGLWRVTRYGDNWYWTPYPAETIGGINSNSIFWIDGGPEGHLWVATAYNGPGQNGGLSHRFPNGDWETITGRGLYTNNLYAVSTSDNQTIWVGTGLGLQVSRDGGQSFDIIDFQPRSGFIDEPIAYAFPNPFSPRSDGECVIRFSVSGDPLRHVAVVDLDIYDLEGRLVRTLVRGETRQGGMEYQLDVWDGMDHTGRQVANGLYYYVLKANGRRAFVGKIAVVE